MNVEPPATDEMFDEAVEGTQSKTGDWDRDVWVDIAINVCQLDPDVIEQRETEWIVARVDEERNRYYRSEQ